MANPLLSVRIPIELNQLLPTGSGDRSRVTIEALKAYLAPNPEDELVTIKQRLSEVERQLEAIQSTNPPG